MQGGCSVPSGYLIRRTPSDSAPECPIPNNLPSTIVVAGSICNYMVPSAAPDTSVTIRFDLVRGSDGLVLSSSSICLTVVSAGFSSLENEEELLY